MIYTEFDPLQEVIVGDCYAPGDLDRYMRDGDLSNFNKILEEHKQDLDSLADFLKAGNVKVHRPTVHKYKKGIRMPEFEVRIPMAPLVPRDAYIVRDNTILQTYTSMTDRYFDASSYYDIFREMFDQGYNWISQPPPMLKNLYEQEEWYFDQNLYNSKLPNKLLWHTATMFQAGDAVIYNHKGPGTKRGLEWMKRNLPNTRFVSSEHTLQNSFGHIDHGFILIDDDTVLHSGKNWVPRALRKKKLIDLSPYLEPIHMDNYLEAYYGSKGRYDVAWIDKYLDNWKGYTQEVHFDLNCLILDSKNIVFGREMPKLFKFLDTLGITSYTCNIRHAIYWSGDLHCSTLDLKRQGVSRQLI
jgi:hypothetical protein